MRVRSFFTTVVLTALVVACSNPPVDEASRSDADLPFELELALFAADGSTDSDMVVSELELAGRETVAPAPAASAVRLAAAPIRSPRTAPEQPRAEVVTVQPAAQLPVAEPVDEIGPVAVATGGDTGHAGHGRNDAPQVGRDRGIIIRGGVSVDDDCALHRPGGGLLTIGRGGSGGAGQVIGAIGALVNDRVSRPASGGAEQVIGAIGALVNDRVSRPASGGAAAIGGARGGGSRGGVLFAGGIR
jgi:hypothetical protein